MAIDLNELSTLSDAELEVISQNSMIIKVNRLQNRMTELEDKLEKLEADRMIYNSKLETHENKIENMERLHKDIGKELTLVKDVTFVLATDDGKRKALTKLVNSLCYKRYTDKKNSLKDKLFHRALVKACYDRLYNQFEVNSYTRIKIDDFDEAKKVVNRWFNNQENIRKTVSKRLREYINDEYLSDSKKKMVDKFLEMTNGGENLW